MTSPRIVAAFQPAFLSHPPSEMSASDHLLAAETMIFMVENQDHFLIGIRGGNSEDEEPAKTPVENTSKAASDDISEQSSHSVGSNSYVSNISDVVS
jgi:hypothetical protein